MQRGEHLLSSLLPHVPQEYGKSSDMDIEGAVGEESDCDSDGLEGWESGKDDSTDSEGW